MRGIILAGGTGSRLYPLTKVTNKHLLPVYNKPMIYYPLFAMKQIGITNVMIVSGRGHAGDFLELLGSGSQFGMKISYEVQEEAGGIAQALSLTENFAAGEKIVVILGDNVFEDDLSQAVEDFGAQASGAKILVKEVSNPQAYGVVTIDDEKIVDIVEKPSNPASNLAVVGAYMYDSTVYDVVRDLSPSARNELEITDVNKYYLNQGTLTFQKLKGFWGDCGESFDSLMEASKMVQNSYLGHLDSTLTVDERAHRNLTSDVKVTS